MISGLNCYIGHRGFALGLDGLNREYSRTILNIHSHRNTFRNVPGNSVGHKLKHRSGLAKEINNFNLQSEQHDNVDYDNGRFQKKLNPAIMQ